MNKTFLPAGLKYRLYQLIEAEYAASKKSDGEFAEYANGKLDAKMINANHVSGARVALHIAGTRSANGGALDRLHAVETGLAEVQARLPEIEELRSQLGKAFGELREVKEVVSKLLTNVKAATPSRR